MPLSPYYAKTQEVFKTLNQQLIMVMELGQPYQRDDIAPGKKYGYIAVRSLAPGKTRDVRAGTQMMEFELELMISAGATSFSEAIGLGSALMLEIDTAIPHMKQTLMAGAIRDLTVTGEITCIQRQSIKPPQPWLIDIGCSLIAPIAVHKDKNGEHQIAPSI